MTHDAEHMLGNAATASQHLPIIEDPVVRGALLRSFAQYIELNRTCTYADLIEGLKSHPDWHN